MAQMLIGQFAAMVGQKRRAACGFVPSAAPAQNGPEDIAARLQVVSVLHRHGIFIHRPPGVAAVRVGVAGGHIYDAIDDLLCCFFAFIVHA